MPFPKSVPRLSREEYRTFLEELDAFESSDEMEASIDRHREALRNNADE
ncbi:hypothetical protein HLRTI_001337 [Halorhabdus tiamatea SARL4B]|uniref:Uncharacterized protein n=1 Tax=Halorhabdus tiamatea SARL4B TaxID=1033806 RepID=F7PI36_9EURY|nr:hypothetical protein [Halorhabdus tiamatea]ERJ06631.1 hypothetical protein HLRTI_001337 [Halorhabdus tiamatea SARL4B]CCQ32217.1 hypothetical protein HTIA_0066 [Halorhabdus tiamatea SARL4B]